MLISILQPNVERNRKIVDVMVQKKVGAAVSFIKTYPQQKLHPVFRTGYTHLPPY